MLTSRLVGAMAYPEPKLDPTPWTSCHIQPCLRSEGCVCPSPVHERHFDVRELDFFCYFYRKSPKGEEKGLDPLTHNNYENPYTPLSTGKSHQRGHHEDPRPQLCGPSCSHFSAPSVFLAFPFSSPRALPLRLFLLHQANTHAMSK